MSLSSPSPCRLCCGCAPIQVDVYAVKEDGWSISEAINRLFNIWIQPTDKLPSVICHICLELVKIFYNYYLKVEQVQKNLYIQFQSSVINNEEDLVIKQESYTFDPLDILQMVQNTEYSLRKDISNENTIVKEEISTDLASITDDENEAVPRKSLKKLKKRKNPRRLIDDSKDDNFYEDDLNFSDLDEKLMHASESPVGDQKEIPTEIFKDGKLTVSRRIFNTLLKKFYNMQCDVCERKPTFTTCQKLFDHYKKKHNTEGYVTCCGTRLTSRKLLYYHMKGHLQTTPFQCSTCKKKFQTKDNLVAHMKRHIPISERPYKCDQCERRFIIPSALKRHQEIHTPIESRVKYECKECNKTFTILRSYETHNRNVHSGLTFLCPVCGKDFKTKTCLDAHMYVHDPHGQYRVPCKECGFVCKNKQTLYIHMKGHAAERFQCGQCDFSTPIRSRLRLHVRVKHCDHKPYTCPHCPKTFKMNFLLRNHMVQHSGEHKYTCTFCPRTFANSGNFYSHRKRMHPEEYKNLMKAKEQLGLETISLSVTSVQ